MEYELELEKAVSEIKKENAKTVLLQLPDGLKPQATKITKYLEENTDAKVLIWADSCFGACDYPVLQVDLLIQFGHSPPSQAMPKPGGLYPEG